MEAGTGSQKSYRFFLICIGVQVHEHTGSVPNLEIHIQFVNVSPNTLFQMRLPPHMN